MAATIFPALIPAGGLTLLSTTTLSGASTTISNINQNHKNLLIVGDTLNDNSDSNSFIQLNGNSTSTAYQSIRSGYSYITADAGTQNWARYTSISNGFVHFLAAPFAATTNYKSVMWIYDYTNTTPKNVTIQTGMALNGSGEYSAMNNIGTYEGGSGITSLKYYSLGSILTGTIKIYGA
jgi:hypothetical protein